MMTSRNIIVDRISDLSAKKKKRNSGLSDLPVPLECMIERLRLIDNDDLPRNFVECIVERLQLIDNIPLDRFSDLPLNIVECIIGRLPLIDRVHCKAVCKAWDALNPQIPTTTTVDKYPWAMEFRRGKCRLIDPPFIKEYVADHVEDRGLGFLTGSSPLASSYGWILFHNIDRFGMKPVSYSEYVLYSPFTTEVICLPPPPLDSYFDHKMAISLDASVIFTLHLQENNSNEIGMSICSPGYISWKTYKFDDGPTGCSIDVCYGGDGCFYCLFSFGELGVFNLALEKWTILTLEESPGLYDAHLIAYNGQLQVMTPHRTLLKFDFYEKLWIDETSLMNNRVLFIGCTSFSCPTAGETSQLANRIFQCHPKYPYISSASDSRQYKNWSLTTNDSLIWIEFPSRGIWRANDLFSASLANLPSTSTDEAVENLSNSELEPLDGHLHALDSSFNVSDVASRDSDRILNKEIQSAKRSRNLEHIEDDYEKRRLKEGKKANKKLKSQRLKAQGRKRR